MQASDAVAALRSLPSVDELLQDEAMIEAAETYGRQAVVAALRAVLTEARSAARSGATPAAHAILADAAARLQRDNASKLRAVFNLTGTVIHTNLGRAILAEAAIEAATRAMRQEMALEFDLANGKRGERDALVRDLLCELTGAEDATLVNNNAGAVLIALNTFAKGREAIVSRGELIEIGGAFRMPDIMARAGAKLREVGTTNRTHLRDYVEALTPQTGLAMKVHTSNYRVEGFACEVGGAEIANAAHAQGVVFLNDLGSGTLVDLAHYGLSHEPTVAEAVTEGADLVTFSGDKLLGGAQAGFIVGKRELIAKINKNPLKRALRVDKIRLAAIEATLRLYRDPDRLAQTLPTLRRLARPHAEIETLARELAPKVQAALGDMIVVDVVACASQIGSGALPLETLPSAGLALRPQGKKGAGRALEGLAARLRAAPTPILGRIEDGALILDLRCLERPAEFLAAMAQAPRDPP
jgi:L-seryl-tRNA(Ser) seleniumtransferase